MPKIGPQYLGEGKCEFRVWAPSAAQISLRFVSPAERIFPLDKDRDGYFYGVVDHVRAGDRYVYRLHDRVDRPDPASHYQPNDVFGPSCVVDHSAFSWKDHHWKSIPLDRMIIYEIHVGTFTAEGTFDGVLSKLPYLQNLGINAVEIMPVAQFPGARNWGYDGVYPFAVQHSYGGPDALKKLVDECHARQIGVILDVVYNHLGPEGNFLPEFMPCLTDKYKTPWGNAINFDDAYSDGVRNFFIQNALYWFEHFHVDFLRLDAIHGIFDMSAKHFLKELSETVGNFSESQGRKYGLIAESDLNDVRTVAPYSRGGYGLDAQWNDDFHHCLHTLLTHEMQGYYQDFGRVRQLAKAIQDGFVYSWDYSAYRKRSHGSSSADIPASRLVVFAQNHDQTGNRLKGERLAALVPFEALKIAAALVLLSANIPLLFMGEEYGEDAPFLYFMSFHDPQLVGAVREGRKKEFASFDWPQNIIDPFDQNTFLKSKLQWSKIQQNPPCRILLDFYKTLIQTRQNSAAIRSQDKHALECHAHESDKTLSFIRRHPDGDVYIGVNFNAQTRVLKTDGQGGEWEKILDTSDRQWLGPGSQLPEIIHGEYELFMQPLSLVLYRKKT